MVYMEVYISCIWPIINMQSNGILGVWFCIYLYHCVNTNAGKLIFGTGTTLLVASSK